MSSPMNYRKAVAAAIADEMEGDDRVLLIGEDVGRAGGAFKLTPGLFERFGEARVRDAPISEQAIVGAATGSALMGLRPVVDLMFADFAGVAFDQIANQLAKYRYMTGGQVTLPVTIMLSNGAGSGFAAQHSQSTENWFLNIPGLKLAVPATVPDLYGLLRSAIRCDDPVLVFVHKNLFAVHGEFTAGTTVRLGEAALVREGTDVTIVATQQMRHRAFEAAGSLDAEGIRCAVIDPRTLAPFDDQTVLESVHRTSRLLVVQEAPASGSWGASLIARLASSLFEALDAPPALLAADDTPIPYAGALESAWMPSAESIAAKVRELVAY